MMDLLPCPHCSSDAAPKITAWDGNPPMPGWYVVCSAAGWDGMEGRGCGCSGAYGETKEEAVAAWNRRPSPSPTGGEAGAVTRIDILREWFGGERYARDYEYFDANFGQKADRVVTYLSALTHPAPLMDEAGWRDMDSAPKDGTHILACRAGDKEPAVVVRYESYGWRNDSDGYNLLTHWMPLPAAPALTKLQEGGR